MSRRRSSRLVVVEGMHPPQNGQSHQDFRADPQQTCGKVGATAASDGPNRWKMKRAAGSTNPTAASNWLISVSVAPGAKRNRPAGVWLIGGSHCSPPRAEKP